MNEGDTFGTASGGANQPQFSNSFDRPSGAITSSPEGSVPTVSTAGSSNSSKFFGGKSRFSSRSSGGSSQTNFAAAQQISSNPNTPEFFSEAVMANTPAPVENEGKSKKGLFIGIGAALVAIIVVVVVVVVVSTGGGGGGGGNNPEVLSIEKANETLTRDLVLDVVDLENEFATIGGYNKTDDSFFDKDYHDTLVKNFESYEKVAASVKGVKKVEGDDERGQKLESIDERMQKALPVYKTLVERYKIIYDAKVSKDLSKLNSVDDAVSKNTAKEYIEAVNGYQNFIKNKYEANKCNVEPTESSPYYPPICGSIMEELDRYEDNMEMTGTKAKELIIGQTDISALNGQVGKDLVDVLAYVGEKQSEDK